MVLIMTFVYLRRSYDNLRMYLPISNMPGTPSVPIWVLTRVVNASLDDVVQGEATGGRLSPQLGIDLLGQHLQQMRGSDGWEMHRSRTLFLSFFYVWQWIVIYKIVFFQRQRNVLDLGHVVVVQGEIGVLLIGRELHLVVVVAVLCHGCSCYPTWDEKTEAQRLLSAQRLNSKWLVEILNLKAESEGRNQVYTICLYRYFFQRLVCEPSGE